MTTTIRLWHGTTEQFDTLDISCALGAHFGIRAAAEGRLHDVAGGPGDVDEYEISSENARRSSIWAPGGFLRSCENFALRAF